MRTSTRTPYEMAEVVRIKFGLRKNSLIACKCLLAAMGTGDNRYAWSLVATIVAHAASL